MEVLNHNLKHGLMITIFVFVMMILIDYLNVVTKGRMEGAMKGGRFRQYVVASFLGATPGCLGAFMNVSFYIHGLMSFGAIVGGMIATSGDESFVMLAMFPDKALLLFGILFVLGVASAYIVDRLVPVFRIEPCKECQLLRIHPQYESLYLNIGGILEQVRRMSLSRFLLLVLLLGSLYGFVAGTIGPTDWNWQRVTFVSLVCLAVFIVMTVPDHYLEDHIWNHIAKRHLWRVFLWSFGVLLAVDLGLRFWNLEAFVRAHMFWVLLIAALVGVIPESGPHLIFTMMFAKGLIPFSVLLTGSIVQDGHGMLPLLAYTFRDSMIVKLFNLVIGLSIGLILYKTGL